MGSDLSLKEEVETVCKNNYVSLTALAQVRVPYLFISSGYDPFFSRNMIDRSSHHLPHSEHVHMSESGHSVYFEMPEQFNDLVVDWMRRVSTRSKRKAEIEISSG